jgi:EmrB/QacA subfamily drug resistance transporter
MTRSHRGPALATLCLASLLINLDTTIVNVTLPSLVRQLDASTTDLQWVVDAYNLVFAACVLAAGSLGDRLGRRNALLAGLGVFGAGSLAGAFGETTGQLIAARAVMGLGAAIIFPATLSVISNLFPGRRERAKAIGLWGATTGVGIALGPIVGGRLLEWFWWGSVFVAMVPVAATVLVLTVLFVPDSRDRSTPAPDWTGLVLSTAGMAALVFAIIQASAWGWGSGRTAAGICAGLALLALFLLVERRSAHPMMDIALFRNPRFTAASAAVTVAFFALSGFIFLITQYFQFVKGYAPLETGVRLLPVALSVAAGSVLGARLTVRAGNKAVVTAGLLLLTAAFLWISTASAGTAYSQLALQMVVLGAGMGLTSAPATEAIMGAVSPDKAGVGSAVNDATRLLGGTLGVAAIGSIAASLYLHRLHATAPAGLPTPAARAADDSLGGALQAASRLPAGQAGGLRSSAVDAFLHGFHYGCLTAAALVIVGAVLAVLFLPVHPAVPRTAETEVHPDPVGT